MESILWAVVNVCPIYEVSSCGKVRNSKTGKLLSSYRNKQGYLYIKLQINKKQTHKAVHRLVAAAFVDNPENKPQVNHLDLNKSNNHYSNLEWATGRENSMHAIKNGAVNYRKRNPSSKYKYFNVKKLSLNGDLIEEFAGISKAAADTGINKHNIHAVIRGDRKSAGGFLWKV